MTAADPPTDRAEWVKIIRETTPQHIRVVLEVSTGRDLWHVSVAEEPPENRGWRNPIDRRAAVAEALLKAGKLVDWMSEKQKRICRERLRRALKGGIEETDERKFHCRRCKHVNDSMHEFETDLLLHKNCRWARNLFSRIDNARSRGLGSTPLLS